MPFKLKSKTLQNMRGSAAHDTQYLRSLTFRGTENEEQPHDKGSFKMESGISASTLNSATWLPAIAGIRPDG